MNHNRSRNLPPSCSPKSVLFLPGQIPGITSTWELSRNAHSQALPQTYWITGGRPCIPTYAWVSGPLHEASESPCWPSMAFVCNLSQSSNAGSHLQTNELRLSGSSDFSIFKKKSPSDSNGHLGLRPTALEDAEPVLPVNSSSVLGKPPQERCRTWPNSSTQMFCYHWSTLSLFIQKGPMQIYNPSTEN